MAQQELFGTTRVRDVETDEVKPASEWQRIFAKRFGIGPFDAWAVLAAAIVARTMRIEDGDSAR
jgi:hypothetical protein